MKHATSHTPFALLALAALGACGLVHETAEEAGSKDLAVAGPIFLDVATFNGRIEVVKGAEGAVKVAWTKRGSGETKKDAEADLAQVEVKVTEEKGRVAVVGKRADARLAWASGVSFVVTVPAKTPTHLFTTNGTVSVRGLGAEVDAETSNGGIDVADATGKIAVKSSNGALEVAATDASLRATTSNGSVTFSGSLADAQNVLTSSNGRIEVTLPATARFRLSAHTTNGGIESDFEVAGAGKDSKKALEGTVGESPAGSLTLKTSNGRIRVHRAN